MCNPLAIVIGLQVAAAAAQKRQQDVQYSRTASATKQQADAQQAALVRQRDQQHIVDTQMANDSAKQSLHDMALFDTAAGEYGGGVSDRRAAAIQNVQQDERLATIADNGQTAQSELAFQGNAAHDQALARLGTLQPGSALGLGLQIAGSLASGYAGMKSPSSSPSSSSVRASGSDEFGYKGSGGF